MICDRCDQLMRPAEAETIEIDAATGPGATVYIHRELCTKSRSHPPSYPERRPAY